MGNVVAKLPRKFLLEEFRKFEKLLTEFENIIKSKKIFDEKIEDYLYENLDDKIYIFKRIKVLIVLFLEKYRAKYNNEFEAEILKLLKCEKEIDLKILRNQNLSYEFKDLIKQINRIYNNKNKLKNYEDVKILFLDFDKFNELLAKILIKKIS